MPSSAAIFKKRLLHVEYIAARFPSCGFFTIIPRGFNSKKFPDEFSLVPGEDSRNFLLGPEIELSLKPLRCQRPLQNKNPPEIHGHVTEYIGTNLVCRVLKGLVPRCLICLHNRQSAAIGLVVEHLFKVGQKATPRPLNTGETHTQYGHTFPPSACPQRSSPPSPAQSPDFPCFHHAEEKEEGMRCGEFWFWFQTHHGPASKRSCRSL